MAKLKLKQRIKLIQNRGRIDRKKLHRFKYGMPSKRFVFNETLSKPVWSLNIGVKEVISDVIKLITNDNWKEELYRNNFVIGSETGDMPAYIKNPYKYRGAVPKLNKYFKELGWERTVVKRSDCKSGSCHRMTFHEYTLL